MNTKSFLVGAAAGALLLLPSQLPAAAASPNFIANAAPAQNINFDVKLPLRNSAELDALIAVQSSAGSPQYHHFLTPAQFRGNFGPTAATFAKAEAALRANGFAVTQADTQILHVRGTAATVARTFHSQIGVVSEVGQPSHFAAQSPLIIPAELRSLGATVASLSGTMRPKPMFQKAAGAPQNRDSEVGAYWFDDLKQAYSYPSYGAANGKGVTVATVGESDYSTSDALAYFANEKLGKGGIAPAPTLGRVLLPGAAPFDPTTGISDEADLDVQQVGGSAPGATVVGVAFGTQSEFLDAYSYLDEQNFADIVTTSYGECELYFTAPYNHGIDQTEILQSYHDLFRQGNSQGITFLFSSGDNSGTQCLPVAYFGPGTGNTYHPVNHGAGIWVDDPNVTGVGGTNLITNYKKGSLDSSYVSENEIGDRVTNGFDFLGTGNFIQGALWGSGGGPSSIFAKPNFQKLIPTGYNTRTVPDVSMHMGGCPFYGPGAIVTCGVNRDSADYAIVGGQLGGLIGTSASSPEFAGLLAIKESVLKSRLGNANEDIYRLAAANATGHYFHQGIRAYNGIVHVAAGQPGYNPITGVGTPIGNNFVGLPKAPLSGIPQSPTNP